MDTHCPGPSERYALTSTMYLTMLLLIARELLQSIVNSVSLMICFSDVIWSGAVEETYSSTVTIQYHYRALTSAADHHCTATAIAHYTSLWYINTHYTCELSTTTG